MTAAADMVDLVFGLRGSTIAVDYADRLWEGLRSALPWLEAEAAAVHPLGRVGEGAGCLFLSPHSRLVLRLPRQRVPDAGGLSGSSVDLGGTATIGAATVKELKPQRVLYSSCVLLGTADEAAFLAACSAALDALNIDSGRLIVGKLRTARVNGIEQQGYSLMVHGCVPDESLRLQHVGLGTGRQRGCGVFVQHRSVAPVGE